MKTIFRTKLTTHFTTLPNAMLRDKRLSFRARGVLAMVLSNVEDWEVTKAWLENQGTEGREAITGAIHELEAAGYATFTRERGQAGVFVKGVWTFTDTAKVSENTNKQPQYGKPSSGKPQYGKPYVKKDHPTENHVKLSEEPEESPASPGVIFAAEWRPNPKPKAEQLLAIKPPEKCPSQVEFEEFCVSGFLDGTLDSYRPDFYSELCDAKWHQWRARSNRWVPIRDWRGYVTGLAAKIEEAKECAS